MHSNAVDKRTRAKRGPDFISSCVDGPCAKARASGDDHPAHVVACPSGGAVVCMYGADGVVRVEADDMSGDLTFSAVCACVKPRGVAQREGTLLISHSAGSAGKVSMVRVADGHVVRTYGGFTNPEGVAFLNAHVALVTDMVQGALFRLDLTTGSLEIVCKIPQPRGVAVSANGAFALVACSLADYRELKVARVDLRKGTVSWPFKKVRGIGPVVGVTLSPDQTCMYVSGTDHVNVVRVHLTTRACVSVCTHTDGFFGTAITPDGKFIFATTWGGPGRGRVHRFALPESRLASAPASAPATFAAAASTAAAPASASATFAAAASTAAAPVSAPATFVAVAAPATPGCETPAAGDVAAACTEVQEGAACTEVQEGAACTEVQEGACTEVQEGTAQVSSAPRAPRATRAEVMACVMAAHSAQMALTLCEYDHGDEFQARRAAAEQTREAALQMRASIEAYYPGLYLVLTSP